MSEENVMTEIRSCSVDAADLIEQAIELLDLYGWTKRTWGLPGEPHCLGGALAAATGWMCETQSAVSLINTRAWQLVSDVTSELYPERVVAFDVVVRFNDHKDTTFEDVKLVLKHAIEKARS